MTRTPPPELLATLGERWTSLAAQAPTLERNLGATVVPAPREAGPPLLGALDRLRELGGASTPAVTLERTLGEGGMGVVRLGVQRSLGREVAVKTLREGAQGTLAVVRLLREAWVSGALEHPNVVPVHDVSIREDGSPMIVMKRVSGTPWSDLLESPEKARSLGATDLLDFHLGVFQEVCHAIAFAHSRGILHRDIKPENVMVGDYGEVTVLDWGIAVSVRDDPTGRLPLARDANELAGTPCYLAPEMLGGQGERLGEHTDVYLLGAVLYEILAGRPPHHGEDLVAVLASVLAGPPRLPPGAPGELARVIERAMALEPEHRFASVRELSEAVQQFLRHRGSMRLTEAAVLALGRLFDELADALPDEASRRAAYSLFSECRVTFRAALAEWPENEAAKTGLAQAVAAMAEYELGRGDPRAASALLAELSAPPRALIARVDAGLGELVEQERRVSELEALRSGLDPRVGTRTRTFLAALLGTVWTTLPLVLHRVAPDGVSAGAAALGTLGILAFALALGVWARESLLKTAHNRRLSLSVVAVLALQLVLQLGASALALPAPALFTLQFLLWSLAGAMLAIYAEPRLALPSLGFVVAFLVCTRFPQAVPWAMSLGNLLLTVVLVVAWWPKDGLRRRS